MNKWQPIETAPRDARTAVLTTTETDTEVAIQRLGYWTRYGSKEGWYSVDSDRPLGITPTHWMPLPEPPKE